VTREVGTCAYCGKRATAYSGDGYRNGYSVLHHHKPLWVNPKRVYHPDWCMGSGYASVETEDEEAKNLRERRVREREERKATREAASINRMPLFSLRVARRDAVKAEMDDVLQSIDAAIEQVNEELVRRGYGHERTP
jgi:hypothetical protein